VEPDEPRIAMHENKVKVGAQQLHCLPSTRYVSPLLQNVTDRRSDAGARFLAMSSFEQWQQFEAHLPPAEGKCFHQQHVGTALFESRKQRLCAASLDCGGGGFAATGNQIRKSIRTSLQRGKLDYIQPCVVHLTHRRTAQDELNGNAPLPQPLRNPTN